MDERNYWSPWAERRRLSRRSFLEGLRTGVVAGVGLAAGLSGAGCSSTPSQQPAASKSETPTQQGQPKYGGILRIGWRKAYGYLFPGASQMGGDNQYLSFLCDSFVYTGDDGTPDPELSLAQSWKQEDPVTFTFSLRQGVKFHDGTDYDAQAQKTWFEMLLDPNRFKSFAYRGNLVGIKQMDVVDKYTLRITLKQPDAGFLTSMGGQAGLVASPTAVEKMGPDIFAKPISTGPFMVKSFTPGGDWVFEKNPNYWKKGLPYVDGLVVSEIPDDKVRAGTIQSGAVDVGIFDTPGDVTETLKKDPNLTLSACEGGPQDLKINHALPPCDNLKIRQAIASCIDKAGIAKAVFQNTVKPANGGLVQPGHWAYIDLSDINYKFDLDKARQYLKESGLPAPIKLKVISSTNSASTMEIMQLVSGWLNEAGVQTTLDSFDQAEYARLTYEERVYHLGLGTATARADPSPLFSTFLSAEAYYNSGRDSKDPVQLQINDLLKQGVQTYDVKERKKIYDQVQRLEAQYIIGNLPLTYTARMVAFRKNVKGTDKLWIRAMSESRTRFLWKE